MSLLSRINLNVSSRLEKDKAYQRRFFAKLARKEVAGQLRQLREKRHLTQVQFAKLCKMKQSAVSRIEQADYSGWTYKTLARVAERLDARLRIIFEPAEDVIARMKMDEQSESDSDSRPEEHTDAVGFSDNASMLFQQKVPNRDQNEPPTIDQLAKRLSDLPFVSLNSGLQTQESEFEGALAE